MGWWNEKSIFLVIFYFIFSHLSSSNSLFTRTNRYWNCIVECFSSTLAGLGHMYSKTILFLSYQRKTNNRVKCFSYSNRFRRLFFLSFIIIIISENIDQRYANGSKFFFCFSFVLHFPLNDFPWSIRSMGLGLAKLHFRLLRRLRRHSIRLV